LHLVHLLHQKYKGHLLFQFLLLHHHHLNNQEKHLVHQENLEVDLLGVYYQFQLCNNQILYHHHLIHH
jgi:hypothetical protein